MGIKRQKIFLVFGVILLIFLTACFKQERFSFQEGNYIYAGENFIIYDEIEIKEVSVEFIMIEETEYIALNSIDSIQNRKDKKFYKVNLYIKFSGFDYIHFSFHSLDKVGDQIDRYYIDLEISNGVFVHSVTARILLELNSKKYDVELTSIIKLSFRKISDIEEAHFLNTDELILIYEEKKGE